MARFETTLIGTTTVAEGRRRLPSPGLQILLLYGVDRGASSCACASPAVRLHHAAAATASLRQAPRAAGRAVPYRGAASRRCPRLGAPRTGRTQQYAPALHPHSTPMTGGLNFLLSLFLSLKCIFAIQAF